MVEIGGMVARLKQRLSPPKPEQNHQREKPAVSFSSETTKAAEATIEKSRVSGEDVRVLDRIVTTSAETLKNIAKTEQQEELYNCPVAPQFEGVYEGAVVNVEMQLTRDQSEDALLESGPTVKLGGQKIPTAISGVLQGLGLSSDALGWVRVVANKKGGRIITFATKLGLRVEVEFITPSGTSQEVGSATPLPITLDIRDPSQSFSNRDLLNKLRVVQTNSPLEPGDMRELCEFTEALAARAQLESEHAQAYGGDRALADLASEFPGNPLFRREVDHSPGFVPVYHLTTRSYLEQLGREGLRPQPRGDEVVDKSFNDSDEGWGQYRTYRRNDCVFTYLDVDRVLRQNAYAGRFSKEGGDIVVLETWVDPTSVRVFEQQYYNGCYAGAPVDRQDDSGHIREAREQAVQYYRTSIPLSEYSSLPRKEQFVIPEVLIPGGVGESLARVSRVITSKERMKIEKTSYG